jgi:integrase
VTASTHPAAIELELERGIDVHGDRLRLRRRFTGRSIREYFPLTPAGVDAANERARELERMRRRGESPEDEIRAWTLGEACSSLLREKRQGRSSHTKRVLADSSIQWWERRLSVWRDPDGDWAATPLSRLRAAPVADYLLARAAHHDREAANELGGLKAVLRHALSREQVVSQAILALDVVVGPRRERRALSVDELEYFVAHAPLYARRMLLVAGTVGTRIGELWSLAPERIDPIESTLFVPARLCKERRDKTIDLTREELELVLEQINENGSDCAVVFPSQTGVPWSRNRYGDFHRMVWAKTVARAAAAWRKEHELEPDASTPFEWRLENPDTGQLVVDPDGAHVLDRLEPHDLRVTAATLMRDAGYTREQTAARLGHNDLGELLDQLYDRGDARERSGVREAVRTLTPTGIRAQVAGVESGPSTPPVSDLTSYRARRRPSARPAGARARTREAR